MDDINDNNFEVIDGFMTVETNYSALLDQAIKLRSKVKNQASCVLANRPGRPSFHGKTAQLKPFGFLYMIISG